MDTSAAEEVASQADNKQQQKFVEEEVGLCSKKWRMSFFHLDPTIIIAADCQPDCCAAAHLAAANLAAANLLNRSTNMMHFNKL